MRIIFARVAPARQRHSTVCPGVDVEEADTVEEEAYFRPENGTKIELTCDVTTTAILSHVMVRPSRSKVISK